MKYRKEIDGLRAIAVLPVIFFHAGFEVFSGGFVGVDVFFVISGYLITTIIFNEIQEEKFSLMKFYERRARRILPALFFVMFFCLPLAWILLLPSDMKSFSRSLVAVTFFSSNILFWRESGYFDTAAELKPLLHTWSLAVEEQYYVLFPIFLLITWRLGKRYTIVAIGLICVASFALAQWALYSHATAAFYLLPTRAWELLVGALAAFHLARESRVAFSSTASEVAGWLGFALILSAVFLFNKRTPFPGAAALIPVLGALLIIIFATQRTHVGKFIGNNVFVGIGLISYSAYLWHQPLFSFFRHSDFSKSPLAIAVLISMTFVFSAISWKFVESPFRVAGRFKNKYIVIAAAFLSLMFVVFGLFGQVSNGFSGRERMIIFKDLAYDTTKLGYTQCNDVLSNEEPKLNYCLTASDMPNALVVGDSHAEDKFYGIEKNMPNLRWKLVGNSSCPPLVDVNFKSMDGTDCTERLRKLFFYVNELPNIKVVVLSFAHMYPLESFVSANRVQREFDLKNQVMVDIRNPDAAKSDAFFSGLERVVYLLNKKNVITVISLDIPELGFFPIDCLRNKSSCYFSRNAVMRRQELHRSMAFKLASEYKNVFVFDSLPVFCGGGNDRCSILIGGRTLYRDSDHLSHYGSLVYGENFSKWYKRTMLDLN